MTTPWSYSSRRSRLCGATCCLSPHSSSPSSPHRRTASGWPQRATCARFRAGSTTWACSWPPTQRETRMAVTHRAPGSSWTWWRGRCASSTCSTGRCRSSRPRATTTPLPSPCCSPTPPWPACSAGAPSPNPRRIAWPTPSCRPRSATRRSSSGSWCASSRPGGKALCWAMPALSRSSWTRHACCAPSAQRCQTTATRACRWRTCTLCRSWSTPS
mmetsp:Transcript_24477/g.78976  ORF Transcript_24477/g.78976 Transcript_24477/m.78976 type:complete len:215 (+) Transcript_24477:327-971(+)